MIMQFLAKKQEPVLLYVTNKLFLQTAIYQNP